MTKKFPLIYGIEKKYLLRWVFNYSNGDQSKGIFDGNGEKKAYLQSKENLISVAIEGRSLLDNSYKTFLECNRDNFLYFQWDFATSHKDIGNSSCIGLRIITINHDILVLINGEIKIEKRENDHKIINSQIL